MNKKDLFYGLGVGIILIVVIFYFLFAKKEVEEKKITVNEDGVKTTTFDDGTITTEIGGEGGTVITDSPSINPIDGVIIPVNNEVPKSCSCPTGYVMLKDATGKDSCNSEGSINFRTDMYDYLVENNLIILKPKQGVELTEQLCKAYGIGANLEGGNCKIPIPNGYNVRFSTFNDFNNIHEEKDVTYWLDCK